MDSFLKEKLKKFKIEKLFVLARNTDKFLNEFPEFKSKKIEFIKGDLKKIEKLPFADIVIHAATSANQTHYKLNSSIERLNIEKGASNYIKIAKKIHKKSKIVYCSSGAVYGKQPNEIDKIDEDFPFQKINKLTPEKRDYAIGKRNAEEQIKELGNSGFNVAIARCFTFYGDYLPKDGHFAYGNFLNSAEQGKDIRINATHEVIRSYMHADELVESLIKIALSANSNCPVYNVGSDKEISIFDLANQIASNCNVRVTKPKNIDLKKIDLYVPNTDKLKRLLNNS